MTALTRQWWTIALAAVGATVAVSAAVALAASLSVSSDHLTVFRTCVISGATNTSTTLADSWVDQKNGTTNENASVFLDVTSENSRNHRTYLRFDLTKCTPTIPSTATVRSATVRLYAWTLVTGCRTHDLFTVPATPVWTEAGITWNNQPFGTAASNPPQAQRKSFLSVGTTCAQNNAQGYVTGWDVTADVQTFANGTATNNGWMIRDDAENAASTTTTQYISKAGNSIAASPQLFVTYST